METDTVIWNSLEFAKLLVAVLTPVTVAVFGWFISRRLKKIDLDQWSNQKVIEKRLDIYDKVAPKLNNLLCFYTWVGDWKEISPQDVIVTKRELDKVFNVYRHLFDESIYKSYQSLINALFETYVGPGEDAKIISSVKGNGGDRSMHCAYDWSVKWDDSFSSQQAASVEDVRANYYRLMDSLRSSLGLHNGIS